ncbi:REF/SRPP-like protein At1g67360 [Lathyrus oleraceus]|uniref:REF/SRPP-like protein At1g67360 n=1 Tax=Pisum sativum TaxID=3888 RepID=UPI0021CFA12D|nr:REF/SRPP-like protein At1g67360 [Pisum sativum]
MTNWTFDLEAPEPNDGNPGNGTYEVEEELDRGMHQPPQEHAAETSSRGQRRSERRPASMENIYAEMLRHNQIMEDRQTEMMQAFVDEATHKFNEHAPTIVKKLTNKTKTLIRKVTYEALKAVNVAQFEGPREFVEYVATESKNLLLINSMKLWDGLNQFPSFHAATKMVIPTSAHWSKKYNHIIKAMDEKVYKFVGDLPLIHIDDISKAFK